MRTLSFLGALFLAAAVALGARAWDGCRAADVSGDGRVDATDVAIVEAAMGLESPREDLDGDGTVADPDLVIVERYAAVDLRFRIVLCPACPADTDGNGRVDTKELAALNDVIGRDCRPDLNRDGVICPKDVELLEAYLGSPVPLSLAAARADLDGNGAVDLADRDLLADRADDDITLRDCRLDLNRDGRIDSTDVWGLLAVWGPCSDFLAEARPNLEATCDEGEEPGER